jgi:hypothetical protein
MIGAVELKTRAKGIEGHDWHLFSVEFDTCDGRFSTYIYAINEMHAHEMLADLKQNGRLNGSIEGSINE